jgi:hypothetical protein
VKVGSEMVRKYPVISAYFRMIRQLRQISEECSHFASIADVIWSHLQPLGCLNRLVSETFCFVLRLSAFL